MKINHIWYTCTVVAYTMYTSVWTMCLSKTWYCVLLCNKLVFQVVEHTNVADEQYVLNNFTQSLVQFFGSGHAGQLITGVQITRFQIIWQINFFWKDFLKYFSCFFLVWIWRLYALCVLLYNAILNCSIYDTDVCLSVCLTVVCWAVETCCCYFCCSDCLSL